jgi:hypothetical protein
MRNTHAGMLYHYQTMLNNYSGTSLNGHLCQEDATLRTPKFSPKMVISIHFDHCKQDTSQLRTAAVSSKVSLIERFHKAKILEQNRSYLD